MGVHDDAAVPADSAATAAAAPSIPRRITMVAVASSAGGVLALRDLIARLPAGFASPVLVIQHLDRTHPTALPELVAARAQLPVKLATDGERAQSGVVYICPPDHHLLVAGDGTLTLTQSAPVHFVRPAADLLFESIATAYGTDAVVCVLTGTGQDGAMGVTAVHSHGGTVIVQDPGSAAFPGMPQAAIDTGAADFVGPLASIADVLIDMVGVSAP